MDPKNLIKLAKACRAAGIKHYKCPEFEFTLTDEVPVSNYKKRVTAKPQIQETSSSLIETDSLTTDQLLMWSTGLDESTQ